MPVPRTNVKAATANNISYFGGGGFIGVYSYNFFNNVDIYNSNTNTWSVKTLSAARIVGASASVGNKVLFAGGRQILNYSNRVDLFDVTTGIRSTYNLSQARTNMATAVVGNKVLFAGGETGNISNGVYTVSNKVDIYDNSTGTWSSALLSSKRDNITAAVVGNKVLFAGGIGVNGVYSNKVDIYDASTNTWSTLTMSEPKYSIAAATAGNKVYLAGGTTSNSGSLTNRVDIYDALTNSFSYVTLSSPQMAMTVAQTPNRIMFAGGNVTWGNVGTNIVEVLNLNTNTWTTEYLSRPRFGLAAASYGNKAMFAGGAEVLSSYALYSIISKRVDIWTDVAPNAKISDVSNEKNDQTIIDIIAFPNPFSDKLTVNNQSANESVLLNIFDISGKLVYSGQLNNKINEIDLSSFVSGVYIMKVTSNDNASKVLKLIKN